MDRNKNELKKTKNKNNKNIIYKCITANTSAIWLQAAHTTYQPSSPSCSTRAIHKKAYFSTTTTNQNFHGEIQENRQLAQNSMRTRLKHNRRDGKGESNDSPEILDRR